MTKLRLKSEEAVTVRLQALNHLTIANGVLVGGDDPANPKIYRPNRESAAILTWTVPGISGAVYIWRVDIPGDNRIPVSQYALQRTATQTNGNGNPAKLLPIRFNPKEMKIKYRHENQSYFHLEIIELV